MSTGIGPDFGPPRRPPAHRWVHDGPDDLRAYTAAELVAVAVYWSAEMLWHYDADWYAKIAEPELRWAREEMERRGLGPLWADALGLGSRAFCFEREAPYNNGRQGREYHYGLTPTLTRRIT